MVWESVGITYNLDNNQATTGNSFNWLSVCYGFCHPDSFSLGVVKSPFGMNCPAPPEWYHLFTENRSETALALWFTEWVRIPEDHTPKPSLILLPIPKNQQRTCDAPGVTGVHGRRYVCSFAPKIPWKDHYPSRKVSTRRSLAQRNNCSFSAARIQRLRATSSSDLLVGNSSYHHQHPLRVNC